MGFVDEQRMSGKVMLSVISCHLFRTMESDGLSSIFTSVSLKESKITTYTFSALKSSSVKWEVLIIPTL